MEDIGDHAAEVPPQQEAKICNFRIAAGAGAFRWGYSYGYSTRSVSPVEANPEQGLLELLTCASPSNCIECRAESAVTKIQSAYRGNKTRQQPKAHRSTVEDFNVDEAVPLLVSHLTQRLSLNRPPSQQSLTGRIGSIIKRRPGGSECRPPAAQRGSAEVCCRSFRPEGVVHRVTTGLCGVFDRPPPVALLPPLSTPPDPLPVCSWFRLTVASAGTLDTRL